MASGLLSPGSKCDRYDIVRLIGAGGMGEVYQAMHEFTKKPVALKVLKVSKEHHVEKMRTEAMVLCRIKHPNLVEVYDAGIADVQTARGPQSLIWMAMELLEGESLRERLVREGAVRPAMALEWIAQAAEGVQTAHDAKVIHRDLKPENVFLTKRGDVRVLDFGTAKFEGYGNMQTRAGDSVGTIPYMSPEHIGGEELDGRSDVYALGFILYEMLAGRHPFSNAQGGFPPLETLLPMVIAGDPESLAHHVGAQVWEVVRRCLEKDKRARFGSMKEVAQAARHAAAAYGTDASGVALRLSGNTDPATPFLQSGYALTPPPVVTPGATPVPPPSRRGVSGWAIATMALVAALAGAAMVVATIPKSVGRPETLASGGPTIGGPAPPASSSAVQSRPEPAPSTVPAAPPPPAPPPSAPPSVAPDNTQPQPPNTPRTVPRPNPPPRPLPPPLPPPSRPPCPKSDEPFPPPCPR
jgi:serine/threonine protein kinase